MPNNQGVLYQDCIEVSIMKVGCCRIHIHQDFDALMTAEDVAEQVHGIWAKYVVPMQAGFKEVSAPYREMQEEQERICYRADERNVRQSF